MENINFKCKDIRDEMHILGVDQILFMKPIVTDKNEPFILVKYRNDDFCITEKLICKFITKDV